PAEVAGGGPEDDADEEGEHRRDERELEGDATAGEQAEKLVAPERPVAAQHEQRPSVTGADVRPERDGLVGDRVHGGHERLVGPVAEDRREERLAREAREDDQREAEERGDGDAVPAKAPPGDGAAARRPCKGAALRSDDAGSLHPSPISTAGGGRMQHRKPMMRVVDQASWTVPSRWGRSARSAPSACRISSSVIGQRSSG